MSRVPITPPSSSTGTLNAAQIQSCIAALPEDRQERVRRVAADCSKAVSGYMTGNLVISVIAGTLTYIVLWIMGVPYKGVVALFVGFADLIPLIGATLGAIVAIAVAALHSLPAALVVLVFFVVYQQAENHLLQPVIVSRTVQLSALMVTIAILLGVELLGFLGALLAIPVAGHPARHRPRPLRRLPGPTQARAHHRPAEGAVVRA